MSSLVTTYFIYAIVAVGLTGILANTLHRNGRIFLKEIFDGREEMATAINTLLVTGFYMLNLGYAFLIFRSEESATTFEAVENLVYRLGALLVSLGVIHFINMAVIWRLRNYGSENRNVPATYTAVVDPPPVDGLTTLPPPPTGAPVH